MGSVMCKSALVSLKQIFKSICAWGGIVLVAYAFALPLCVYSIALYTVAGWFKVFLRNTAWFMGLIMLKTHRNVTYKMCQYSNDSQVFHCVVILLSSLVWRWWATFSFLQGQGWVRWRGWGLNDQKQCWFYYITTRTFSLIWSLFAKMDYSVFKNV